LGVTTVVFFLTVIDVSAVNVAFPSIADDFGVSKSRLSWIISGYNVTVATGLLLAGRLADSLGRKKVFLPGVVVFLIGSLLSGLAPGVNWLIGARVVQAVGGSIVAASSLAVVLPDFPLSKRGTVIGIAGATAGLGAVAGPALGSILINAVSWRAIFLLNVPLCLLILAIGPRLLRESKDPNASGRIDLLGVPIGTGAIALIMFAIVQSESWGLTDPRIVALLVVGLALIPVLIWRSARHPEPLLDLTLFRVRSFSSSNLGAAFFSAAFTSGFLVNSLVLQDLWDQSITTTGMALVPAPILAALCSPVAGRFSDRFGHRWLLGFGSALCGLANVLYLLLLDEEPAVFNRLVPISLILGVGIGLSISSWSSAGLADIGPAKFGTANATIRTVQQGFYALGIAVVVTLLAVGAERTELTGFRWAWSFVAGAYLLSAIVIMIAFPSGSSQDRLAPVAAAAPPPIPSTAE
jgi:EmrB/QacA subfamily drug resistance transporter